MSVNTAHLSPVKMQGFQEAFQKEYSTALIADAAYRVSIEPGVPADGIYPIQRESRVAGTVRTVDANNDLAGILLGLHRTRAGELLAISSSEREVGLIGDIIAHEAVRGGLAGILVDGSVRDTAQIREIGFPVFCRGRHPVGPLKIPIEKQGIAELDVEILFGGVPLAPGQWIVADSDGILILNSEDLPVIHAEARRILERETRIISSIRSGTALGNLFQLEHFAKKRENDRSARFGDHLSEIGGAI